MQPWLVVVVLGGSDAGTAPLIPTESAYRARRQVLALRAANAPARLVAASDPARLRARRHITSYRAPARPDTYEAD